MTSNSHEIIKMFYRTVLVEPKKLIPHEETLENELKTALTMIKSFNANRIPVLIDGFTGVIIDGHHRVKAALKLDLKYIPAFPVNYLGDNRILVYSRRKNITITKEKVIKYSLEGKTFPPKTTRHILKGISIPAGIFHLETLKGKQKTMIPVFSIDKMIKTY